MLGDLFEVPGITFTHGAAIYSGMNAPTSIKDSNGKTIADGSLYIAVTGGTYKLVTGAWKLQTLPQSAALLNHLVYENAGEMAMAAQVMIDNGELTLISGGAQTKPAASSSKLAASNIAGVSMPVYIDSYGYARFLQGALWKKHVAWWTPAGNSATDVGINGMSAPTVLGTAKAIALATDILYNRQPKLGFNSSNAKGNFAGLYTKTGLLTVDRAAGVGGGFLFVCRFGFSDASPVSGTRAFIGLSSSIAAPTNVEPNTQVNSIGIAQLSTDATQLYLTYGGAAPQAAIGLSNKFPPSSNIPYELTLIGLNKTEGVIAYRLERLDTNVVVEGVLTPAIVGTQTPAETTLLAPRAWRTNNANNGVVGLDIGQLYMESYV